jgi:small subunit ribosomal protein S6
MGAARDDGCPKEVERIMRTYELMTIFRPELAEADVRSEVEQVVKALTDRGAESVETDFWGKRRFAYEIDHINEGYYAVQTFSAEPAAVADVERALTLSDNVVRHKVVRPA